MIAILGIVIAALGSLLVVGVCADFARGEAEIRDRLTRDRRSDDDAKAAMLARDKARGWAYRGARP